MILVEITGQNSTVVFLYPRLILYRANLSDQAKHKYSFYLQNFWDSMEEFLVAGSIGVRIDDSSGDEKNESKVVGDSIYTRGIDYSIQSIYA